MRADLGAVLGAMGFKAKDDFIVDLALDGLSASIRQWFSGQAQPSDAAIAAFDMSQSAIDTRAAQDEKAKATASVDHGQAKSGKQFDRLCVAVGQVALDAVNSERAAMDSMNAAVQAATSLADLKTRFAAITFPPQVTMQQLSNAIKAKIAATPE